MAVKKTALAINAMGACCLHLSRCLYYSLPRSMSRATSVVLQQICRKAVAIEATWQWDYLPTYTMYMYQVLLMCVQCMSYSFYNAHMIYLFIYYYACPHYKNIMPFVSACKNTAPTHTIATITLQTTEWVYSKLETTPSKKVLQCPVFKHVFTAHCSMGIGQHLVCNARSYKTLAGKSISSHAMWKVFLQGDTCTFHTTRKVVFFILSSEIP